jgi:hypothetical protein
MNSRTVAWDFGPPASAEGFRAVRRRAVRRRARTTAGVSAPLLATLVAIGWSMTTPAGRPDSLVVTNHGSGPTSTTDKAPAPASDPIRPGAGGAGTNSDPAVATGPGARTRGPSTTQSLPPLVGVPAGPASVHVSGSSTAGLTWTVRRPMTLSFGAASVSGPATYVAVYLRGLDNAVSFGAARSPDVSYALGKDSTQWLPFAAATPDLSVRLNPGRYRVYLVTDQAVDVSVPADHAGADVLDLRPTQHVTAYATHDVQGLGGAQSTVSRTYDAKVTTHSVGFAIVGFRQSATQAGANATISLCLPQSGQPCQAGDPQRTHSSPVDVAAMGVEVPFDHDTQMTPTRDASVTGSISAGMVGVVVVFVVNVDLGS